MIVAEERTEYGFVPILVGAALAAGIGGGAYYLGRKSIESRFYDCLTEYIKRGTSVEEARKLCGTPYTKPTLLQQLAFIPIAIGIGYVLYRSVKKGKS